MLSNEMYTMRRLSESEKKKRYELMLHCSESTQEIAEREVLEAAKSIERIYLIARELLKNGGVDTKYKTFVIPKRNGKKRFINEPEEELKEFQSEVVRVFTDEFTIHFPGPASAYIEKRSITYAAKQHIYAEKVLRLDLKDFFSSCTLANILSQTRIVYPFCLIDQDKLEVIIRACTCYLPHVRTRALPQGAPSSPFWSNVMMLPIDLEIQRSLQRANLEFCAYTRYADDMHISFRRHQNGNTINETMKTVVWALANWVEENTLWINHCKRQIYDSKSGAVQMLGLSVSRQGVKLGNRRKQRIKAELWTFLADWRDGDYWSPTRRQHLSGIIYFALGIEPDFIHRLIKKYEEKTNVNFWEVINLTT